MKTLVLSIIKGYNFFHVSNFIYSLKSIGYEGDVFFFVHRNTGRLTLSALRKHGIQFELFDDQYPYLPSLELPEDSPLARKMHLFNYRHLFYEHFLKKHQGDYDYVMLSDVRDVVFQANPFAEIQKKGLFVAMENEDFRIGDNKQNIIWLSEGFGRDNIEMLLDKPISCAGTTLGDTQSILRYVNQMIDHVRELPNPMTCIDQAIHNYMLHRGELENVEMMVNEESIVQTMALMKNYSTNQQHQVVNRDGTLPCVLHQYDRHAQVNKWVSDRLHGSRLNWGLSKAFYKLLG